MHHPTDRIAHTTAFVTPVVEHWLEREIVQSGVEVLKHSTVDVHVRQNDMLQDLVSISDARLCTWHQHKSRHTHTHTHTPEADLNFASYNFIIY